VSNLDTAASAAAGEHDPAWRSARRAAALESFAAAEMPTQVEEIWRYVDLDFDLNDFGPAAGPADELGDDPLLEHLVEPFAVGVVGDTFVGPELDDEAFTVMSLQRAAIERSDVVESLTERVGLSEVDGIFGSAANAFGGGGVFIHAGPSIVAPSVVAIDVHAGPTGSVSFPTVAIAAEEHADVSVVVHLRSAADSAALVVPQFSVVVGPGARVSLSIVQNLGYGVRSLGFLRSEVGADARFHFGEVGLGGRLARLHLDVGLEGRGSSANVVGAYFGEEHQILDYRYFMRHVGTNTRSDMFLKGAVEDEARSVFTGMIRIEESGQKTEAFQTNRNLILSDGASAQSVPNLEILANDVRCGHGSTVGPLDTEQRYYLMSRGLAPARADRLQVRGFFAEALAKLPHPELTEPVGAWINRKYETAQEEGRVR
jgi:Fe-S cluster assembly protein SufD